MQSRLLPKVNDLWQFHPKNWKDEFKFAKKANFNCIEWIIDKRSILNNPFFSEKGQQEILNLSKINGIKVNSICADILLETELKSNKELNLWKNTLKEIINSAVKVKAKNIVIPLLEWNSLENDALYKEINIILKEIISLCTKNSIYLALELDINPRKIARLLEDLNSEFIGINYDSGNSASCGYDMAEEFSLYKSSIINVHVKDRNIYGKSCLLGTGIANLPLLAEFLINNNRNMPITMETYRDNNGFEIAKLQKDWFDKLISNNFCL